MRASLPPLRDKAQTNTARRAESSLMFTTLGSSPAWGQIYRGRGEGRTGRGGGRVGYCGVGWGGAGQGRAGQGRVRYGTVRYGTVRQCADRQGKWARLQTTTFPLLSPGPQNPNLPSTFLIKIGTRTLLVQNHPGSPSRPSDRHVCLNAPGGYLHLVYTHIS